MGHVLEVVVSFAFDLLWLMVKERRWRAVGAIGLSVAIFVVGELTDLNPRQPIIAFGAFVLVAWLVYGLLVQIWKRRAID